MAAPAEGSDSGSRARGPLETLLLAGVGSMALAAERVDELADALAQRLGADPGEVRSVVSEVLEGWRREAERLGEHASAAPRRVAAEVGLASEDALAELELRVARVEHRLKLLEGE